MKLATRVSVASGLAAALAALLAAGTSWMIAERLVDDAEDRRLEENARVVLSELPKGAEDAPFVAAVDDEVRELAPMSIRVSVHRDGRRVAGDDDLPLPSPSTCVSTRRADAVLRACTVREGSTRVVTAAVRAHRTPSSFVLGCVFASAFAAIVALLAGRRATAWALGPLTRLRASLADVRADEPHASALEPDGGVEEVAQLRAALAALVARLGDSLSRARRFSADASHELRTPLTTIAAELDLLAEEDLSPSAREAVGRLQRRARDLGVLVEQLLVLATDAPTATEAVALEDVVEDALRRLSPDERARIDVAIDADGMVAGDATLLRVLVDNVVGNALKFSTRGRVDVRVSATDDEVVLEVADDGPGLGADGARAFEPFFRASSARAATSGHGIGLALVKHIASVHAGTVAFVDGERTRFRLGLPVWRRAAT